MNKKLHAQVNKIFFRMLAEEKEADKIEEVFGDLLNDKQRMEIVQRVACALYLDKSRSHSDIAHNLLMKQKDIKQVSEGMGNRGIQYLIQHVKAEEFAHEWSSKIMKLIKTVIP